MRESANLDYAPAVLLETRGAVGIITLNSPANLHALTLNIIRMIYQALRDWSTDDAIACVVLQSSTDKAFCAGGDVRTLRNAILAEPSAMPNQLAQSFFSEEYRLDYLIHTYPKPLVVWGGGIVMGGGLGLLAGASHRVVTPTTRIAMPEITIGLFPDVGGSWFLPRMPGRSGLFLGLTGAALNAHDALFTGLGDYFLPQEQREAAIAALAAAEWQGNAAAVADRVLRSLSLAADALPVSEVRQNWDTINTLTAGRELGDVVAAITAYQGDVVWLQRAAASLAKGAPSSVALVWALQERSRHLSLADVFRMELVVALQCCAHPDFPEGVRALLVDKDNAPQWSPRTLDEALAVVDEFFQAPGPQHPLADLN